MQHAHSRRAPSGCSLTRRQIVFSPFAGAQIQGDVDLYSAQKFDTRKKPGTRHRSGARLLRIFPPTMITVTLIRAEGHLETASLVDIGLEGCPVLEALSGEPILSGKISPGDQIFPARQVQVTLRSPRINSLRLIVTFLRCVDRYAWGNTCVALA